MINRPALAMVFGGAGGAAYLLFAGIAGSVPEGVFHWWHPAVLGFIASAEALIFGALSPADVPCKECARLGAVVESQGAEIGRLSAALVDEQVPAQREKLR